MDKDIEKEEVEVIKEEEVDQGIEGKINEEVKSGKLKKMAPTIVVIILIIIIILLILNLVGVIDVFALMHPVSTAADFCK